MPWTFSHPAVVFPIKQSRFGKALNLPALIIGSISPDLFYSVGLYPLSTKAHHFIDWFYTALPLCIAIFILFSILSTALEKLLPIPISLYKKYNFSYCLIIIVSLYLGAVTHILWDGFTHETGSFVRNIQILQYNLLNSITNVQEIRVYKCLQYLGSLLGLVYLCMKYRQYQHKLTITNQKLNQRKLYTLFGIAVLSGVLILPIAIYQSYTSTGFYLNKFVFNQLRLSELLFFVLIIVIALWINYREPKN